MYSRLLKSWLRLLIVWWIGTTIWWALSDTRIAATLSALTKHKTQVNALTSGLDSLRVLWRWSAPVFGLALATALAGAALVGSMFWLRRVLDRRRVATNAGSGWRRMSLSMGTLEKPRWADLPMKGVTLDASGEMANRLAAMSEAQKALFLDVLGVLAAHKNAFVGDGHTGTLLEHTTHVIERLPDSCRDPLLPIAAAAHDAGKILAWEQRDGQWKRVGWHDDLGGLMLSAMPHAADLPENELRILVALLRFAHKREKTPRMPEHADTDRLRAIQDAVTSADHEATAVEKQEVLQKIDRPTLLFNAFVEALPTMKFQTPSTRKGTLAVGWRKGKRSYFSEPRLREVIEEQLRRADPAAAAAYSGERKKGHLHPMTADLLSVFGDKGWLVKTHEGEKADPPLWVIRAGSYDFTGIVILDLPDNLLTRLPEDAPYPITITAPLTSPQGQAVADKKAKAAERRADEDKAASPAAKADKAAPSGTKGREATPPKAAQAAQDRRHKPKQAKPVQPTGNDMAAVLRAREKAKQRKRHSIKDFTPPSAAKTEGRAAVTPETPDEAR